MKGYVYLIGNSQFGWYKIGKSVRPNIRVKTVGVLLPFTISVFAVWESSDHSRMEAYLHRKFASLRIQGEWFRLSSLDVNYLLSRPETKVRVMAEFKLKRDTPEGKKLIIRVVDEADVVRQKRITDLLGILCLLCPGSPKKKKKLFHFLLSLLYERQRAEDYIAKFPKSSRTGRPGCP